MVGRGDEVGPRGMLLAIDIGNTHIKFGLFAEKRLEHKIRLVTDQLRTEDEYGVLLEQSLAQRGVEAGSRDRSDRRKRRSAAHRRHSS